MHSSRFVNGFDRIRVKNPSVRRLQLFFPAITAQERLDKAKDSLPTNHLWIRLAVVRIPQRVAFSHSVKTLAHASFRVQSRVRKA
jgi:hypothetical protein